MNGVPDVDVRLASAPDAVCGDAVWIRDRWRGSTVNQLVWFTILHGYQHLGEMHAIRGRLGIRGL
jgi:hypothetical protein